MYTLELPLRCNYNMYLQRTRSIFIFVELDCISTNIEYIIYHKYISFERSSFCLSTDIFFHHKGLIHLRYITLNRA